FIESGLAAESLPTSLRAPGRALLCANRKAEYDPVRWDGHREARPARRCSATDSSAEAKSKDVAVAGSGVKEATISSDRKRPEVVAFSAHESPTRSAIPASEDAVEEGGCVDGLGSVAKRECRHRLAPETSASPGSAIVRTL